MALDPLTSISPPTPRAVRVWHYLLLVFQFNLNIKCFVLSLHSIIVSGRLQVTDVANKQVQRFGV